MTSTEYRDLLDLLALTQAEMAELLGVSIRTAHGYANGARIPQPVARFLALTLSLYERGRPAPSPDTPTATRAIPGTSSRRSSSRFGTSSPTNTLTPVRFPPGRERLATSPTCTGSSGPVNTIGMGRV